jgi:urease accessory protein
MILITEVLSVSDDSLSEVSLLVERHTLAKRLWRGMAADGVEFGFQLASPLKSGDVFYRSTSARYVIVQEQEPVLSIALDNLPPSAVAGIAWSVGNLHLEFSSSATHLYTPDEPAARQLFARIQIGYTEKQAVFRPGRFTRYAPTPHELGSSHKH